MSQFIAQRAPVVSSSRVDASSVNYRSRLLTVRFAQFCLATGLLSFLLGSFLSVVLGLSIAYWPALTGLSLAVLSIPPLIVRQPAPAWSLLLLSSVVGLPLRSWLIVLEYPSGDVVDNFFTLGVSTAAVEVPLAILLTGFIFLSAGYLVRTRPVAANTKSKQLSQSATNLIAATSAVIASLAFLEFARRTGGLSLDNFSSKRALILLSSDQESFRAHTWLRVLHLAAPISMLLLLSDSSYRSERTPFGRKFGLLCLLAISLALPLYSSQRTQVVILLMQIVFILFSAGKRIRVRSFLALGLVGLILFGAVSGARSSGGVLSSIGLVDTVQSVVVNLNLNDGSKQAHIIRSVPDELEFQNGNTIATALLTPIPREIWPGKPIVSSGPIVGREIYGLARSGVPPGLIAELYWNFGLVGMAPIAGLVGVGLRRLESSFRTNGTNAASTFVFSALVFPFSENLIANGVQQALSTLLFVAVIAAAMLHLASYGAHSPSTDRQEASNAKS